MRFTIYTHREVMPRVWARVVLDTREAPDASTALRSYGTLMFYPRSGLFARAAGRSWRNEVVEAEIDP